MAFNIDSYWKGLLLSSCRCLKITYTCKKKKKIMCNTVVFIVTLFWNFRHISVSLAKFEFFPYIFSLFLPLALQTENYGKILSSNSDVTSTRWCHQLSAVSYIVELLALKNTEYEFYNFKLVTLKQKVLTYI